ncbi:MAG: flagellar basal body P-ring formation protein FlgA [Deltaproteobacteria bacterium]|nr:flagellar basal body P-ring formation protein FlgA [Deltaproteobacteria bacterium]
MMKNIFKFVLLIVAMIPVWLTIVALGATTTEKSVSEASLINTWKDKINSKLLLVRDRRIQVIELAPPFKDLFETSLTQTFELDLSDLKARGNSTIGLKILDTEGRLAQFKRVNCRLLIQEQVPVATRDLSRDSVIRVSDFKMEWRDASTFSSMVAKSNELVGKVIRNQVRQNDILLQAGLQNETIVARGDRVKISVVGKGLSLTATGIAQEAGVKGQSIKIQNPESRKELVGVVTDTREVEVRL